jgi:hypothetical protein
MFYSVRSLKQQSAWRHYDLYSASSLKQQSAWRQYDFYSASSLKQESSCREPFLGKIYRIYAYSITFLFSMYMNNNQFTKSAI